MDKKITVIVPIYNVKESLVEICIKSIVKQTYPNLDIILVDDGNDEEYALFLRKLSDTDSRIRIVKHEKNLGLFQARLTGVYNSTGEYIAFVDADDSISIDWFRLLINKAEANGADIVMGNTICQNEDNQKYVFNRNYSMTNRGDLEGEDILSFLVKDCGLDFSRHTVWNKLYTRKLWNKARKDFERVKNHLVMTEDILFSFILFSYANKLSFSNHDGYFYYRNAYSSTINTDGFAKCKKNIEDIILVFSTIEGFLIEHSLYGKYKNYWKEWKNRYFRFWCESVKKSCSEMNCEQTELVKLFFTTFGKDDYENASFEDTYIDSKRTPWNSAYENIKVALASNECEVVSFDLFDTLIVRPVLYPEDVYNFVLEEVDSYPYAKETLIEYRKLAENHARRMIAIQYPQYEDVKLSEIYVAMNERYAVPIHLCEKLKKKEIDIEIEFAIPRKTGIELYELAHFLNKKVYITSDMYLEKDTIDRILDKNGLNKHMKVLLSSEERLLKATGHLFDKLKLMSGCRASNIIHIGDNWDVDAVLPTTKGIKTFFFAKTKDILLNYLGDVYTGNAFGRAVDNTESIIDFSKYFENLSVRCMYATIANLLFDNPYVSYNAESDYNCNPFYIGAIALGPHMFGISKWLIELSIKNNYKTIHFSSRDGYYLKKIYDLMQIEYKGCAHSNYLHISRKSLIPINIYNNDMVGYILKSCSLYNNTPESIINRYLKMLKPLTDELIKIYKDNGFIMTQTFKNQDEFARFLRVLQEYQLSVDKTEREYLLCQDYLKSQIGDRDAVFDLGYSGKLHKNIIDALGINVDGLYVSKGGYDAIKRIEDNNLNIISYYDFKPSMEGIINEFIFSERGPSCVGYKKIKGIISPIFETPMEDYIGDYVINEINRGAYEFVSVFMKIFSDRMRMVKLQPLDSSLLYEKYLLTARNGDMDIFDCCKIEDEFYGGITEKPLIDIWNWQLTDRKVKDIKHYQVVKEYVNVPVEVMPKDINELVYQEKIANRSKLVKAIYWFLVDKDEFKKRIRILLKILSHGRYKRE